MKLTILNGLAEERIWDDDEIYYEENEDSELAESEEEEDFFEDFIRIAA